VLIIPAGTSPVSAAVQANGVVKPPGGSQGPGTEIGASAAGAPGESGTPVGLAPEPAGLATALAGACLAGLAALRRRRTPR
jgi:hypothetical protein